MVYYVRILICGLFLLVWGASFFGMASGITTAPALDPQILATKPMNLLIDHKSRQPGFFNHLPDFAITGTADARGADNKITLLVDFWQRIETTSRFKSKRNVISVYATGNPARPYVSTADIEHDRSMWLSVGGVRFGFGFLFWGLLFLVLPALPYLVLTGDEVGGVQTPEEKRKYNQGFKKLLAEIEARSSKRPGWLKRKTIKMAFKGYVTVIGSGLLLIAAGIGLGIFIITVAANGQLALFASAIPIWFGYNLLKPLFSGRSQQSGTELSREEAPRLFNQLDQISAKAGGAAFKRVFVTADLNASVSRSKGLLGFMGFGPVTLTIGLPLMQSTSPDQLIAVLGHEYGHVAAKDNALSHWVYRIRGGWMELEDRLKIEEMWYTLRLNRFYRRFIGDFSVYSFALSRQCEYDADKFSAIIAGRDNAVSALNALGVRGAYYDTLFWGDFWKESKNRPMPEVMPYTLLANFFKNTIDFEKTLDSVREYKTGIGNTHPSPADRVAALDGSLSLPEPLKDTAAEIFLGGTQDKLLRDFDNEWWENSRSYWEGDFAFAGKSRALIEDMKGRDIAALSQADLDAYMDAAIFMKEPGLPRRLNEEYLRRSPENMTAIMNDFRYKLFDDKDASVLGMMDTLIARDQTVRQDLYRDAYHWYRENNIEEKAEYYRLILDDWEYEREAGREERELLKAADVLLPHDLPENIIKAIHGVFHKHEKVKAVYVARKKVKYLQEYPQYIVGIKVKAGFQLSYLASNDADIEQRVIAEILSDVTFDSCYSFFSTSAVSGFEKKLKKLENAAVFER